MIEEPATAIVTAGDLATEFSENCVLFKTYGVPNAPSVCTD